MQQNQAILKRKQSKMGFLGIQSIIIMIGLAFYLKERAFIAMTQCSRWFWARLIRDVTKFCRWAFYFTCKVFKICKIILQIWVINKNYCTVLGRLMIVDLQPTASICTFWWREREKGKDRETNHPQFFILKVIAAKNIVMEASTNASNALRAWKF